MKLLTLLLTCLLINTANATTEFTVHHAPGGPSDKITRIIHKYLPDISDSARNQAANDTHGWSCDDVRVLCKEAAMNAVRRSLSGTSKSPLVAAEDLTLALGKIQPASEQNAVLKYIEWANKFSSNYFPCVV